MNIVTMIVTLLFPYREEKVEAKEEEARLRKNYLSFLPTVD